MSARGSYRDKTLRELEEELRNLKEKEKYYHKLSQRVKELQEKSRRMKRATDDLAPQYFDDEQIERLKIDIERTLSQSKRIEEDNRIIKYQTKSLENQLKALQGVNNTICNDNKNRRLRIQLRDEQLMQKENEVQSLMERRNCNQLVIQELRAEINKLQDEQNQLNSELDALRLQRQQEEKEKQRLRATLAHCKRETLQQEKQGQQHRIRLAQIKEANYIVKEELITLIKLQEKLKSELDNMVKTYQNTVSIEAQSQRKILLLQEELSGVQQDVKLLTYEYLKENSALRQDELQNQRLNQQMDQLAKEVLSAWQSVRQLIDLKNDPESDIKTKAHRIWMQISQILALK